MYKSENITTIDISPIVLLVWDGVCTMSCFVCCPAGGSDILLFTSAGVVGLDRVGDVVVMLCGRILLAVDTEWSTLFNTGLSAIQWTYYLH